MVQDLLAGNIDLWFGSTDQLPLVRAGSIKAYAVTGEMRLAAAPDIPTFDEMGLPADGVETPGWHGLFAPSGTPREVISKLNAAVVDALADPAAATAKPHRYYGTVTLDASRVGRDAGRIADEVVAHLTGLVGSNVTVTLEIEANIPGGVPDNVVRTVTENSRTLKFKSHGFKNE